MYKKIRKKLNCFNLKNQIKFFNLKNHIFNKDYSISSHWILY